MSSRARCGGDGYNQSMGTPRILGLALAIACVAALCLLSTVTASVVAGITLIAVGIDGLRSRPRPATDRRSLLIDLTTRDYLETVTGHDR